MSRELDRWRMVQKLNSQNARGLRVTQRSYYHARYYNPSAGRFLSEDPLSFFEGPNFYAYTSNDPTDFTDPSGDFIPLPIITGAIGAGAGFVGDLGGQIVGNIRQHKPLSNIDWKEVAVATGGGAVAGALAPVVATTTLGASILGGVTNVAQMFVLSRWEHKCITTEGALFSFGIGAVGGVFGGASGPTKPFSTTSPYIKSSLAKASNASMAAGVAERNAARNFGTGFISNLSQKSPDCGCQ